MNNFNYNNMGNAPYVRLLPDRPNLKNRVDPDAKIRMSLDDIIQIYGPTGTRQKLRKKPLGATLTKNFKRAPAVRLNSFGGGQFFVAKNSPLIKRNFARNREMALRTRNLAMNREIELKANAEMNRALNAPILQEKEEIVLAKYKMIKTKNGVQRILVPANADQPMPMLKVPVPRRPIKNLSKPPPLIDSAMNLTGSVRSFKSAKSMKSSLSARLGPPPLIEVGTSIAPPPLIVKKVFSQPPPLIESKIKPPPLLESNFKFLQPPPLIEARNNLNMPPLVQARKSKMMPRLIEAISNSRPPPLVEGRSKVVPLIDITDDYEEMDVDVKPPPLISSTSFRSLNERFSNFSH